jgi:DNA-binding transcriptional MerR regulator
MVMAWTVSELARMTGLTVRTLHHYDHIGLVTPGERTPAGYRQYGRADLQLLQQVLYFRELGFGLTDIQKILSSPAFDRRTALVAQKELLKRKANAIAQMIDGINRALAENRPDGAPVKEEEMFTMFENFDPKQYEDEVRRRWGDTPAYAESKRRTAKYGKDQWKAIQTEMSDLNQLLAQRLDAGAPPDSAEVMDLAERHRLHIDRWFYPCTHDMHRSLGALYVDDPRFAAHYEQVRAGLAQYLRDAIEANARRQS